MTKTTKPKSSQPLPEDAKLVFKGKIFDVYQWEQKVFDGSTEIYEKLKRPDTVMVIPVTREGKILITKQEQPGHDPFIGLAGGRAEEGEDPEETARRELLEETGYTSDELVLFHSEQPIGKIDWSVYIFIAKNAHKIQEPKLDSGEKIEIEFVNIDEFLDLVITPEFRDVEIKTKVYEAKLNPEKMHEIKKQFV